jgi:hypothetical protein
VESAFLSGLPEKLGGAICMQYNRERGEGHFLWTHTTASMGIGFQVPVSGLLIRIGSGSRGKKMKKFQWKNALFS